MSVPISPLTQTEICAARAFMRLDESEESDEVVCAFVEGARAYLAGAGVSLPEEDTPRRRLYDLVCHSLALSAYDKRDPVITGTIVTQNPMLRSFLTQLKLTEPSVSNLDTDGQEEV